jgi:benzil reductase ((S)-benzoin forming)
MNATILITGVSSGIGLGLAEKYLQLGATVYGLSRRRPALKSRRFHFQSVDLSAAEAIAPALESFRLDRSILDMVILNAGIYGRIRDLKDTQIAELRDAMTINVWSNKILLDFLLSKCAHIEQVIGVSSRAADKPHRGSAAYCISKAALNMLVALYATEWPKTHFCTISPPVVETAIQDYLINLPADSRFDYLETLKDYQRTGQMLSPECAAEILVEAFDRASKYPSGSFVTELPSQFSFMEKLSNRLGMPLKKTAV